MDNLVELYCHIDDFCKAYTAEQGVTPEFGENSTIRNFVE